MAHTKYEVYTVAKKPKINPVVPVYKCYPQAKQAEVRQEVKATLKRGEVTVRG